MPPMLGMEEPGSSIPNNDNRGLKDHVLTHCILFIYTYLQLQLFQQTRVDHGSAKLALARL